MIDSTRKLTFQRLWNTPFNAHSSGGPVETCSSQPAPSSCLSAHPAEASREDSDAASSSLVGVVAEHLDDLTAVVACMSSIVRKSFPSHLPHPAVALPSVHPDYATVGDCWILALDSHVMEKAAPIGSGRLIDRYSTNIVIEDRTAVASLVARMRHLAKRWCRCVHELAVAGYVGASCAFPCSLSLASFVRIDIFAVQ
jgi:hypothetical protein